MSSIEGIVDSLENRISKVLHRLEVVQQTNAKLSEELATVAKELNVLKKERKKILNFFTIAKKCLF